MKQDLLIGEGSNSSTLYDIRNVNIKIPVLQKFCKTGIFFSSGHIYNIILLMELLLCFSVKSNQFI